MLTVQALIWHAKNHQLLWYSGKILEANGLNYNCRQILVHANMYRSYVNVSRCACILQDLGGVTSYIYPDYFHQQASRYVHSTYFLLWGRDSTVMYQTLSSEINLRRNLPRHVFLVWARAPICFAVAVTRPSSQYGEFAQLSACGPNALIAKM